jgi:hypothetical protein
MCECLYNSVAVNGNINKQLIIPINFYRYMYKAQDWSELKGCVHTEGWPLAIERRLILKIREACLMLFVSHIRIQIVIQILIHIRIQVMIQILFREYLNNIMILHIHDILAIATGNSTRLHALKVRTQTI